MDTTVIQPHDRARTPTIDRMRAARAIVGAHVPATPLHSYPGLCDLVGTDVWVKHENHHTLGAFKVRGGVHLAAGLDAAAVSRGLLTASTGNYGVSIANGGALVGAPVTIAVPEAANPAKWPRFARSVPMSSRPARTSTRRGSGAMDEADRRGARFVGPTDPDLIEGVGTYALEILDDLPNVDVIIVPVGSGSGASAVSLAVHATHPDVKIIAVQAEAAPAAYRSWRHGRHVEAPMRTVAEGLATRVPFANTQTLMREHLSDFLVVSDAAMEEAARLYLRHAHTLAEHAGAAPLAIAHRDHLAGRRVVLVCSGGNLTTDQLTTILA